VRSADDVAPQERIDLRLARGRVAAVVSEVSPDADAHPDAEGEAES
jgi:hypothetical protein